MSTLERLTGVSWRRASPAPRRWQTGSLFGVALVAAVTGVIELLKPHAAVSGLAMLYLLAVLPAAVFWGTAVAVGVSLLSAAALAFQLDVSKPADGVALGVFLLTALVVSELSARSSREARVAARLAEEHAALRRIATLVARGVPPAQVFSAVAEEVARLLPADSTFVAHLEPDSSFAVLAVGGGSYGGLAVGERRQIEPPGPIAEVVRTGGPARTDDFEQASGELRERIRKTGVRSSVVTPIAVEGRLWGVIAAASRRGPFPADTERRMVDFTELVATAIANTESRAALGVLADEQAALRRVATLVARGLPPTAIFTAVAEEIGRLVGIDGTRILRYEADGTATVIAGWSESVAVPSELEVGARLSLESESISALVLRTGRPARIDDYPNAAGPLAETLQRAGVRSGAGAPIVVEGRLWGVMTAGSTKPEPLPAGMELRFAEFTELLATAIANAESRSELAASRARIVAASDATRRRVERDLHDGAQQQLVTLGLALRSAQARLPPDLEEVQAELSRVCQGLTAALEGLREMSRGIHPAILSEGGLAPALKTLARRSPVPVGLDVRVEGRLPDGVEVAAYYVVSETLTNTAKHAQASEVHVDVAQADGIVHISVRDDGVGGADPARGTGLVGLRDRCEALGGTLAFQSARGAGTQVEVMLPLDRTREGSIEDAPLRQATTEPH